jgi:hypothetical protein
METQLTNWGNILTTSLGNAMTLFALAIPKIIGFAFIVIIGWLVAALLARAIGALLRAVRFNELAHRSGLAGFVQSMGTRVDSAAVIGLVVKWFVRLITLMVAFDALGLPAVSDVLRQLVLWLPNVVVAVVILVIAGLAANALSNIVRASATEAGLENAAMLGKLSSAVVWAFGIIVAVGQLGIATVFVNTLVIMLAAVVALALGLAFGLGGRDTAAQIVQRWYRKSQPVTERLVGVAERDGGIGGVGGVGAAGNVGSIAERRMMERRAG